MIARAMRSVLQASARALRAELGLLGKSWRRLWGRRRFRQTLAALAALALLLAISYLALSLMLAAELVRTARVVAAPPAQSEQLAVEDVEFRAGDGLLLRGWLVKPTRREGRRLVILLHSAGYGRAEPGLLPLISGLAEAGFSVLAFDGRGHGASEGDIYSLSYHERHDLEGALSFAQGRGFSAEATGVLGMGTGGTTALLVAAEGGEFGALALDSTIASLPDALRAQLRQRHLPGALFWGIRWAVRLRYGPDLNHILPEAAIARMAPRPLLVIQGLDDQEVPADHARRLAQAAGASEQVELWIAPAGHMETLSRHQAEYLERVISFFDRSLRSQP